MDAIDKQILNILQEDTRTTNARLGELVGLSAAAVHGRIKRLEKRGIIRRFTVELAPEALNMQVLAFAQVYLQEMRRSEEAAAAFARIPEVVEVHYTVGEACFLLKLRCPDTASLEHVLTNINDIPPVRATQTIIVLRSGKQQINPPLYVDESPTLSALQGEE
ncbi:Lrp/AsnC family transcriptional regulator [Paucidesulfovibrio longus]|jgi:DNA-binding Lrp family transcriptional regulator|uniref:Lrp/AsnC family transcriptional regulator n=1 Tax=Paucidesulfovibrio longus TaxID=889 RepID=UPI0003B6CB15|nr:Lrp/AsnC family transcriptional regulator [Paucidesulfovibrio longus]